MVVKTLSRHLRNAKTCVVWPDSSTNKTGGGVREMVLEGEKAGEISGIRELGKEMRRKWIRVWYTAGGYQSYTDWQDAS